MMSFADLTSVPADHPAPFTDQLRLAVAAYLARFAGSSRQHTESDLRCYLSWCTERGLDPLAARRPHLELCIRWMQEIRRFKPSTVSRRFSVTAGFYRTCVLDGVLEHSPAEQVRRPSVPAESPTLGFTHLQFEAREETVTRLPEARLGTFDFFLDIGCFQGLDARQRLAQGEGASALANPGATLLMLSFGPSRWRWLTGGVSQEEIETAFAGWEMLASEPADTAGLGWPMNKTAPRWYRLGRPV